MPSNFPVNIIDGTFTVFYDSGSFMSPGVYSFAIYPNADTVILDIGGQRLFDTSSMPYRFSFTMDSLEVSHDTLENLNVSPLLVKTQPRRVL
jgi:hypothetical protein